MQTTDVRETAQNAVNQGKSLLGKQVDDRTTQIGQQIGSVAQDLRNVGDQLRQSGAVGAAAGYVDQGADLVERLGTVSCPVLIVHGREDPIPLASSEAIARGIFGATLVVLEACGHVPYVEAPDALFAAIDHFLSAGADIIHQ